MNLLRLKKNNKGMTLVELLVAIAIFAAAIVPMMYAFVYSTAYNFKSQQTMQSTGIAQAVIEKCKGANVDHQTIVDLLNESSPVRMLDDTQFTGGTYSNDGTYYWINGVRAVGAVDAPGSNRRVYNVRIKLTPIRNDAKTDYTSIQSMTNDTTYNFCDFLTETLSHEDVAAEGKIVEMIKDKWFTDANCLLNGHTGTGLASYFSESDIDVSKITIDRLIEVTANDSGVNVTVTYYFGGYDTASAYDTITFDKTVPGVGNVSCSCRFNPLVSGERIGYGDDDFIHQVDFDSYTVCDYPVTSVFFYYFPGYINESDMHDHFIINSRLTGPINYDPDPSDPSNPLVTLPERLDFYLYKQFKPLDVSWTETQYLLADAAYDPEITLTRSGSSAMSYFYNNLWWHVKDTSVTPGVHDYSLEKNTVNHATITFNDDEWKNCTVEDTIYSSNPYSSGWRDTTVDAYGLPKMYSHLLRDYENLPGYFDDIKTGVDTSRPAYYSRYRIEVVVFSANTGDEVESMYSELLNW